MPAPRTRVLPRSYRRSPRHGGFRRSARLNPRRITNISGRGRIRGRTLRSRHHVRRFR